MTIRQPIWMYAFRWHEQMNTGRTRYSYAPVMIWVAAVTILVAELTL